MGSRGLLSRIAEGNGALAPSGDVLESIAEHLRALLNTRKGESVATPHYGILDLNDIIHSYPSAIPRMTQSIRTAIQEFEPRLKNVVVTYVPDEIDPTALRFDITAQLATRERKGMVRFHSQLSPGGRVELW
ncbi:type VI secretion system baseplate subunit TssE [Corallococcus sp. H22C18031201]|uniref:type VI secretion system baseplate subunit TssE n=1 Tax=Citreicoccus inhibens TaxID=2849499 RepID=UPI000E7089D5|nr:type VI secretion system baseplate subunit TssE [Citreicoccus inhibens]MBU8900871.1 type VI secretion system baseplate subunit TssE [Citreicoccus inhibens]RJS14497.1 type VI secretion system baseplate subunit TssE [Corallococcus sp. H22C18031201]